MEVTYQSLKARQRSERSEYTENIGLRVHRALSWLHKAEQMEGDKDSQFIFYWIAFNAAYSNVIDDCYRYTEQDTFRNFIERLCQLDEQGRLADLVWNEFASSIRVLLNNKFVFQPFWDFHNHKKSEQEWEERFKAANSYANKALGGKNTSAVLSVIFSRLYTLRNQIIHGGATWNSSANRAQVRDAVTFLSKFIPFTIEIMMDNAQEFWGEASYPVVE
ncbi:HEPN domain-containing protein [Pseudoalteromonas sp. T1lg22]|uniref:HEPN domain-containing protein n=1 Tax=Pseudoalteromonas sp. T1lg22 TaxID=2077096 RepID=UPI001F3A2803|nr:HEPN domain-containing protein [Pseudoalteromonas sp. T1lg22]